MLDTDLTCFLEMLKNASKTGNICAKVVSMDTCHVLAQLCAGETLLDVRPGPKTKKSASVPD